nr:YhjD/YihY/BrkB family envelope integrity protein [Hungatella hathewayi]
MPGAVFSTLGWIAFSFTFSIYYNNFSNFSVMYDSLTAIALLMLWLYVFVSCFWRRRLIIFILVIGRK